jgi:hypothetical protein
LCFVFSLETIKRVSSAEVMAMLLVESLHEIQRRAVLFGLQEQKELRLQRIFIAWR